MRSCTTGRSTTWFITMVVGIGLGVSCWFSASSWAKQTTVNARSSTASSATKPSTPSQEAKDAKLEKKLDEIVANQQTILQNQQTILQKFDAVMEELRIIKVRATLAGSRGS